MAQNLTVEQATKNLRDRMAKNGAPRGTGRITAQLERAGGGVVDIDIDPTILRSGIDTPNSISPELQRLRNILAPVREENVRQSMANAPQTTVGQGSGGPQDVSIQPKHIQDLDATNRRYQVAQDVARESPSPTAAHGALRAQGGAPLTPATVASLPESPVGGVPRGETSRTGMGGPGAGRTMRLSREESEAELARMAGRVAPGAGVGGPSSVTLNARPEDVAAQRSAADKAMADRTTAEAGKPYAEALQRIEQTKKIQEDARLLRMQQRAMGTPGQGGGHYANVRKLVENERERKERVEQEAEKRKQDFTAKEKALDRATTLEAARVRSGASAKKGPSASEVTKMKSELGVLFTGKGKTDDLDHVPPYRNQEDEDDSPEKGQAALVRRIPIHMKKLIDGGFTLKQATDMVRNAAVTTQFADVNDLVADDLKAAWPKILAELKKRGVKMDDEPTGAPPPSEGVGILTDQKGATKSKGAPPAATTTTPDKKASPATTAPTVPPTDDAIAATIQQTSAALVSAYKTRRYTFEEMEAQLDEAVGALAMTDPESSQILYEEATAALEKERIDWEVENVIATNREALLSVRDDEVREMLAQFTEGLSTEEQGQQMMIAVQAMRASAVRDKAAEKAVKDATPQEGTQLTDKQIDSLFDRFNGDKAAVKRYMKENGMTYGGGS